MEIVLLEDALIGKWSNWKKPVVMPDVRREKHENWLGWLGFSQIAEQIPKQGHFKSRILAETEHLVKMVFFCRNTQVSAKFDSFLQKINHCHIPKTMSTSNFLDLVKSEKVVIVNKTYGFIAKRSPFLQKEAHFCRNKGVFGFLPKEHFDQKNCSAR